FTPVDLINYRSVTQAVSIDVLRASLTITAGDKSKMYGSANPPLTATYAGFVNGDGVSSLTTPVSLGTLATAGSPVGTYPITASGATSANYAITHVNGTLIVTQALLTITADDKTRRFGQPNPSFTASYSGFVNGDTPASLSNPPTLSTPATPASSVGTYPIDVTGAVAANYLITTVSGTLRILPETPVVTWAVPAPITYGTALSAAQLSASASVPGAFVYNPTAGVLLSAGSN